MWFEQSLFSFDICLSLLKMIQFWLGLWLFCLDFILPFYIIFSLAIVFRLLFLFLFETLDWKLTKKIKKSHMVLLLMSGPLALWPTFFFVVSRHFLRMTCPVFIAKSWTLRSNSTPRIGAMWATLPPISLSNCLCPNQPIVWLRLNVRVIHGLLVTVSCQWKPLFRVRLFVFLVLLYS